MGNELDELKYISMKLEQIVGDLRGGNRVGSLDFGVGIIVILLALILWRVW